ncbi:FliK family flagellar hook-length control protein [Buttiauxella noackiae ATCC 51607]|uniref:FliK family flagellar hook-length control protein n=1 Tax=Buttiauxella noackiae ATCC 51607 TaxID=1354255 RepID=A0A1B7HTQ1_9ENTR|nr:flagellar hook-length control protein FliK [Buttiauxella noackiae]OAT19030.1 FliK family flagellar hook-length control protein [Buttiauxella noackiae ATCC 51607]
MIMQPLITTSPEVASTTPAPGGVVAGDKGFSEDFLSLLSQALPGEVTLVEGKTVSLEAALGKTAGKDAPAIAVDAADEKTTLAALLNNLDTPQALSALLSNVKKSSNDEKTAQVDAQHEQTHTLSNADMQALSALFAMLPQQVPVANALNHQPDAESSAAVSLNTLLSGSGIKNTPAVDARVNSTTATDNAVALDSTTAAAKNAPATTDSPVEAKTFTISSTENSNRDAAANNTSTASALTTPTFSTATVATPASAQIAVPVAPQISAQLGSQEWQQAVSQHITLFTRQGQQSAELRLHPEDLGQIQISMKLDDNQAQLQMVSAHSHVRAALEATLPNLRIALAESGIQLGQSSISSESSAGQQQQQSGQQQQQASRSGGTFPSMGDADSLVVPASVQRLASGNNAVDIFA